MMKDLFSSTMEAREIRGKGIRGEGLIIEMIKRKMMMTTKMRRMKRVENQTQGICLKS